MADFCFWKSQTDSFREVFGFHIMKVQKKEPQQPRGPP